MERTEERTENDAWLTHSYRLQAAIALLKLPTSSQKIEWNAAIATPMQMHIGRMNLM